MATKYARKWEAVNDTTHRLSVPGGWIVKTELSRHAVSLVFVADSGSKWVLTPEDK